MLANRRLRSHVTLEASRVTCDHRVPQSALHIFEVADQGYLSSVSNTNNQIQVECFLWQARPPAACGAGRILYKFLQRWRPRAPELCGAGAGAGAPETLEAADTAAQILQDYQALRVRLWCRVLTAGATLQRLN